jgi:hypothetical protein
MDPTLIRHNLDGLALKTVQLLREINNTRDPKDMRMQTLSAHSPTAFENALYDVCLDTHLEEAMVAEILKSSP